MRPFCSTATRLAWQPVQMASLRTQQTILATLAILSALSATRHPLSVRAVSLQELSRLSFSLQTHLVWLNVLTASSKMLQVILVTLATPDAKLAT